MVMASRNLFAGISCGMAIGAVMRTASGPVLDAIVDGLSAIGTHTSYAICAGILAWICLSMVIWLILGVPLVYTLKQMFGIDVGYLALFLGSLLGAILGVVLTRKCFLSPGVVLGITLGISFALLSGTVLCSSPRAYDRMNV